MAFRVAEAAEEIMISTLLDLCVHPSPDGEGGLVFSSGFLIFRFLKLETSPLSPSGRGLGGGVTAGRKVAKLERFPG